jgi:hypothetical protein
VPIWIPRLPDDAGGNSGHDQHILCTVCLFCVVFDLKGNEPVFSIFPDGSFVSTVDLTSLLELESVGFKATFCAFLTLRQYSLCDFQSCERNGREGERG